MQKSDQQTTNKPTSQLTTTRTSRQWTAKRTIANFKPILYETIAKSDTSRILCRGIDSFHRQQQRYEPSSIHNSLIYESHWLGFYIYRDITDFRRLNFLKITLSLSRNEENHSMAPRRSYYKDGNVISTDCFDFKTKGLSRDELGLPIETAFLQTGPLITPAL